MTRKSSAAQLRGFAHLGRSACICIIAASCTSPPSDTARKDSGKDSGADRGLINVQGRRAAAPDPLSRAPHWGRQQAHKIHGAGDQFWLDNLAWNLRGDFDQSGVRISDRRRDRSIGIRFVGWGRQGAIQIVEPVTPLEQADTCEIQAGAETLGEIGAAPPCGSRLEFVHDGAREWWRSHDGGLQQGWILDSRPKSNVANIK